MSKKNIARIILGVLIFAFSFLTWYFLDFAFSAIGDWPVLVLPPMIAFLILGAAIGILFLLEDSRSIPVLFPASLISASFIVFLSVSGKRTDSSDFILAAAALASFLLFAVGAGNARLEQSSRIRIIVSLILRKSLASALTAIALFGTLIFYWSPYARSLDKEIIVPRPLFDAISAPIIKSIVGAEKTIKIENVAASADADFSDQLYQAVNSQINALGKPYKKFIPLGAAITIFFTFKFLGTILIWPIIFLDWLALKALIKLKIVNIKKIPAEQEVIEVNNRQNF